jgi:hypothetical protein
MENIENYAKNLDEYLQNQRREEATEQAAKDLIESTTEDSLIELADEEEKESRLDAQESEEDSEDHEEDSDDEDTQQEESDDKTQRNRESRRERTERRKIAQAKLRAEHEALKLQLEDMRRQNEEITQRVSIINQATAQQTQQAAAAAELEKIRIYEQNLQNEYYAARNSLDANKEWELIQRMQEVIARKRELTPVLNNSNPIAPAYNQPQYNYQTPVNQVQPQDQRYEVARQKFNEFLGKNDHTWLAKEVVNGKPQTRDAELAVSIYDELLSQGYDPRSNAFYDVAEFELKKRIPQKYNVVNNPQKRNAPPIQGNHTNRVATSPSKKFKITKEEALILKQINITNPKEQIDFIKLYREQD